MQTFNSKTFCNRSLPQIKSKYNLKSKARKDVAKHKQYIRGTGGGPAGNDKFDPMIEAISEIVNLKPVVGFPSTFNSDAGGGNDNVSYAKYY